jgi:metal-responsive CopG/Arc/MetJ family transcriptional regulator
MTTAREKFSSQLDSDLLAKAKSFAQKDGKQFQSLLEEALTEYLERHQTERPRAHVMQALGLSMDEFDDLYRELAK